MFWPLLAIIRRHSRHYKEIDLHMRLLSIGCYYRIIEALILVTEIRTKSLISCEYQLVKTSLK
jgi:hypothetical protein